MAVELAGRRLAPIERGRFVRADAMIGDLGMAIISARQEITCNGDRSRASRRLREARRLLEDLDELLTVTANGL